MIKEIPINVSHILAFEVTGKLVADDYLKLRPRIDKLISKEGRVSLLIKLSNFEGWTFKAMWEDLKMGYEHNDDFLRIAFVGNSFSEKIMTEFGDLIMSAEIEYFEDESDALNWLREVKNLAEKDEYVGYRHILVASDFSRYSDAALKKAAELAKPFSAKITLLHATELISTDVYPTLGELAVPVTINNPELEKEHLSSIRKQLAEQIESVGLSKDEIGIEAVIDHPVDTIIDYSKKNNVDLIVMGSHGRRGLARLIGSSTNGVVNHAACDVLTVV